ncbi:hypothetical protein [Priestia abyssalis]|uniref:hypothetical protein n=1 Tax=Priestia abyssalis TaxID=1221450 RepID=UPI0009949001|nr:hypothetical protein [Priestia abyssalis]
MGMKLTYLVTVIMTIVLGLASRSGSDLVPLFVARHAGDSMLFRIRDIRPYLMIFAVQSYKRKDAARFLGKSHAASFSYRFRPY